MLLFWLVWDFEAFTGFGLVWFNGIWIVGYWFVSLNGLLVFGCWSLLQVFDPVFGYGFLECWYWDVGLQFAGLMVLRWFWQFWNFFWFFEFEIFYRFDEFFLEVLWLLLYVDEQVASLVVFCFVTGFDVGFLTVWLWWIFEGFEVWYLLFSIFI